MKKVLFLVFCCLFFVLKAGYAHAESFFVNETYDAEGRNKVEADYILGMGNIYFIVEREFYASLPRNEIVKLNNILANVGVEFDTKIYPRLREVFGEEARPGVDGDVRIAVLLHSMKQGVGGYVRESDSFRKNIALDSNAREMVYLNSEQILNSELGQAYLAHEFQHLITQNRKTLLMGLKEEQWLNEARSEYVVTLLGYNDVYEESYLKRRVNEFLAHPQDALLDWHGRSVDHASVSMFTHYLVDRFDSQVLMQMMNAKSVGVQSINDALASLGYKERFSDVFSDWILAVHINNTINGEEKFKYKTQNLSFGNFRVLPTSIFRIYDNSSSGATFRIDNWSGQWHKFVPGAIGEEATLHLKISSSQRDGLSFPYIVSDFSGGTEVQHWDFSRGNTFSLDGFGTKISSVVLVPVLAKEGFENASYIGTFSIEGFVSNSSAGSFFDGSLIRAKEDSKVYVVKKSLNPGKTFIRWIQSEKNFGFYKHLSWNDVLEIQPALRASLQESFLIRKAGDYKVYEADASGRKKWLDMTPREFEDRGYNWDAVYEVNDAEFNWYH